MTSPTWREVKYGLSQLDFAYMLLEQNDRCAICSVYIGGVTETKNGVRSDACIDHNHKTGEVRALLCSACNKGLGMFKDNPELLTKAIEYLKQHAKTS